MKSSNKCNRLLSIVILTFKDIIIILPTTILPPHLAIVKENAIEGRPNVNVFLLGAD